MYIFLADIEVEFLETLEETNSVFSPVGVINTKETTTYVVLDGSFSTPISIPYEILFLGNTLGRESMFLR